MSPLEVTEKDWAIARAEAESIAKRWVPDHMTARQGLVDNIAASLINARRLERDRAGHTFKCDDPMCAGSLDSPGCKCKHCGLPPERQGR